jgi:hypothetical protein
MWRWMMDYWEENGLIKPQQVVVCAAIKVGDLVITGARHCDKIMRAQAAAAGVSLKSPHQGFIDQFGDFLTREDAMQIVKDNGQPFDIERNGGDTSLFSEGLY